MEDVIINSFNELYKGKEFVYDGKYGRVFGVVDSIFVSQTMMFDENREKLLIYKVDHSVKGTQTIEKPELKEMKEFVATRMEFQIRSTKGVLYEFDKCYIII
jgi:hypothetical protein